MKDCDKQVLQLAISAIKNGDYNQAIKICQRMLQFNQNVVESWQIMADALQRNGKYQQAIICYQRALEIDGNDAVTINNLGLTYIQIKDYISAQRVYQKLISIYPTFSQAYTNLGIAYLKTFQLDKAEEVLRKAVALNQNDIEPLNNLGHCLKSKGNITEALLAYQKAIDIRPEEAHSHWNLSLCLLLAGEFKRGWQVYERRLDISPFKEMLAKFKANRLTDRDDIATLTDKTLLIHAEQGHGDTIHFCRYIALIKAKRIFLSCHPALKTLLTSLKCDLKVYSNTEPLPQADYECLLMSLPSILKHFYAKGFEVPYLFANHEKKHIYAQLLKLLNLKGKPKIAIAWAGISAIASESLRTSDFAVFKPMLELKRFAFFALMKTNDIEDRDRHFFCDMVSKDNCYLSVFEDFSDTAALIDQMDLVISIDTSVAHLAGAIGKKTYLILPVAPDWRWLLHTEQTAWYPSIKIFRQKSFGDWHSVITAIMDELTQWIP